MTCDRVEKSCRSKRYKTAHFMSATELDIEDILSRTFAGMLTPDMIEDSRYHADDLIGTFAYGRYTKCSRVLCTFTRYALESGTKLVHWDRRDHGETYSVPSDEPVTVEDKECFDRTQSSDLDQCKYRCSDGPSSKEADCLVRCAAWCK
jgi:hypothetical protein